MPFSGSGYIYIYTSFGELPAWIVGWNMNLRFGVTAGAQSKVWASYLVGIFRLLGVIVPVWMYTLDIVGSIVSPPIKFERKSYFFFRMVQ